MATEVNAPIGLTSRRSPARVWSSRSSSLRGLRRPFSRVWRVDSTGVGGIVPRGVAGHAAQRCTAERMVSPGESAEQCRGVIPRHVRGVVRTCRCQSIKCPCRGAGSRPVRSSSEAEPRSRWRSALDQDGNLLEGVSSPRARRNPARGGVQPRARRNLTRWGDRPSSEAEFYQCGTVPLERSGVPPEGG
jgi:hypothetical protein